MQRRRKSLIWLFSLAHLFDMLITIYAKEKFHNIREFNPWFKEDVAKKRWLMFAIKKFCIVGFILFSERFIGNTKFIKQKEARKLYQEYIFVLKIATIFGWLVVVSNLIQIVYCLSQPYSIRSKGA